MKNNKIICVLHLTNRLICGILLGSIYFLENLNNGGECLADELKLIKKAQKGDVASFEKIIEVYQPIIYNISYRFAGNADDAADMAQEVFLKMFKNINTFQFKSKLSTWIYRVATNTCLDMVKRKSRQASAYSIDDGIEDDEGNVTVGEVADAGPTPDEVVEQYEVRDIVNSAISQLSEDYKTVIILRDVQGLPYDEIAEIVDCSVGTVKSRISRGRKNLREILLKNRELFENYFV